MSKSKRVAKAIRVAEEENGVEKVYYIRFKTIPLSYGYPLGTSVEPFKLYRRPGGPNQSWRWLGGKVCIARLGDKLMRRLMKGSNVWPWGGLDLLWYREVDEEGKDDPVPD